MESALGSAGNIGRSCGRITAKLLCCRFDALELRERLIVEFATLAGMRPGEILGLKWGAVKTDHCDISMRIYRGDIDRPKTSHSVRKAALSESLLSELDEWRSICPDIGPDAWVFPSEQGDTAIWRDNIWRRRSHPKFKAAGLGWVNFQVMRRTHSSFMNELEVDPKIVADQLGHTLDVNQNVYKKAALHRRAIAVSREEPPKTWSGRRGSNPRRPAWETSRGL